MAEAEDHWFLIIRDRYAGKTQLRQYEDPDEAWVAYLNAETEYRDDAWGDDPRIEVVLIGADSEDGLRSSYSHYFAEGDRAERMRRLIEQMVPRHRV